MELNFVVTILDRVRNKELAALYKREGAKMTFSMLGRGTATSKQLLTNGLTASNRNRIESVEGVNHLFQHCTTGEVTEYRLIEQTIAPEVLETMIT